MVVAITTPRVLFIANNCRDTAALPRYRNNKGGHLFPKKGKSVTKVACVLFSVWKLVDYLRYSKLITEAISIALTSKYTIAYSDVIDWLLPQIFICVYGACLSVCLSVRLSVCPSVILMYNYPRSRQFLTERHFVQRDYATTPSKFVKK